MWNVYWQRIFSCIRFRIGWVRFILWPFSFCISCQMTGMSHSLCLELHSFYFFLFYPKPFVKCIQRPCLNLLHFPLTICYSSFTLFWCFVCSSVRMNLLPPFYLPFVFTLVFRSNRVTLRQVRAVSSRDNSDSSRGSPTFGLRAVRKLFITHWSSYLWPVSEKDKERWWGNGTIWIGKTEKPKGSYCS